MQNTLDPVITEYVAAGNARDEESFINCFAPDAVVVDENQTRRGHEEIGAWFKETREKYNFTARITGFEQSEGETVVECSVSGNFPGSPVDLSYHFKLSGDKIAKLRIP